MAGKNKTLTPEEEEQKRLQEAREKAIGTPVQTTVATEQPLTAEETTPAVTPAPGSTTQTTTTTPAPSVTTPPVDVTRQQLEVGYNQNIQDFSTMILNKKAEMDEAIAEDRRREKEMRDNAAFAGTTELVSSLANLIGVGSFGASNQQYKNFSQDWMRKADEAREQRLSRRTGYRQQLDTMNQKLAALKSGKAIALANYDTETPYKQARAASSYLRAEAAKLAAQARAATSPADYQKKMAEVDKINAQIAQIEANTGYLNARTSYTNALAGTQESVRNANNARANKYNADAAGKKDPNKDTNL